MHCVCSICVWSLLDSLCLSCSFVSKPKQWIKEVNRGSIFQSTIQNKKKQEKKKRKLTKQSGHFGKHVANYYDVGYLWHAGSACHNPGRVSLATWRPNALLLFRSEIHFFKPNFEVLTTYKSFFEWDKPKNYLDMAMERLAVIKETHNKAITALTYNPMKHEVLVGFEGTLSETVNSPLR